MDNKVSIHFGEYKTNSILFGSKFERKNIKKLNIKYGDMQIKQRSKSKYVGCLNTVSGEVNVINKITSKLKSVYRKLIF